MKTFLKAMFILNNSRRRSVRTVAVALLLLLVPLVSAAYTVEEVPNVRLSDARQYVSDPDRILSATARDSINLMLSHLEKTTGIETAVVMLPTIGDSDIFDFAHRLFRSWGIGKKKTDNGFLILFVMDQHKVRFTTGYGLEGVMTDALSKRIQMERMVPCFKRGDWDGGMVAGVRAAVGVLDGSMQPDADADDDVVPALIALAVVLLLVCASVGLALYQSRKCPRCGRHGLRKVSEQTVRIRLAHGRHRTVRRTVYVCRYCGRRVTRDDEVDEASGLAAAGIMGAMGGGSSSGGFGGGSFGGGSTGGGGATSGW